MVQTADSPVSSQPEQPLLFTPVRLGSLTLKNRIVISPMCTYAAEDGFVTDWHLAHLGARAIGGAGTVMLEATAVEKRGRISTGCTGIWKDEHIPPLKRLTDFLKQQNAVPAIQLAHAGRKGSTYPPWIGSAFFQALSPQDGAWQTIAPSPIAYGGGNDVIPAEATLADIVAIKEAFVASARRSVAAGFQVIELHFAHGYLLQTFLSPFSNKRTDAYGGSFENRIRLAMEIVADVKAVLPAEYPLWVRISASDNLPDGLGWDVAMSIELARKLKEAGVQLLDVSSGMNAHYDKSWLVKGRVNQIEMAKVIQRESGLATGAVGGIVNPHWAEKILREDRATLILIGRVSLDDPNWPLHAAAQLGVTGDIHVPRPYRWAIAPNSRTAWRQTILAANNEQNFN